MVAEEQVAFEEERALADRARTRTEGVERERRRREASSARSYALRGLKGGTFDKASGSERRELQVAAARRSRARTGGEGKSREVQRFMREEGVGTLGSRPVLPWNKRTSGGRASRAPPQPRPFNLVSAVAKFRRDGTLPVLKAEEIETLPASGAEPRTLRRMLQALRRRDEQKHVEAEWVDPARTGKGAHIAHGNSGGSRRRVSGRRGARSETCDRFVMPEEVYTFLTHWKTAGADKMRALVDVILDQWEPRQCVKGMLARAKEFGMTTEECEAVELGVGAGEALSKSRAQSAKEEAKAPEPASAAASASAVEAKKASGDAAETGDSSSGSDDDGYTTASSRPASPIQDSEKWTRLARIAENRVAVVRSHVSSGLGSMPAGFLGVERAPVFKKQDTGVEVEDGIRVPDGFYVNGTTLHVVQNDSWNVTFSEKKTQPLNFRHLETTGRPVVTQWLNVTTIDFKKAIFVAFAGLATGLVVRALCSKTVTGMASTAASLASRLLHKTPLLQQTLAPVSLGLRLVSAAARVLGWFKPLVPIVAGAAMTAVLPPAVDSSRHMWVPAWGNACLTTCAWDRDATEALIANAHSTMQRVSVLDLPGAHYPAGMAGTRQVLKKLAPARCLSGPHPFHEGAHPDRRPGLLALVTNSAVSLARLLSQTSLPGLDRNLAQLLAATYSLTSNSALPTALPAVAPLTAGAAQPPPPPSAPLAPPPPPPSAAAAGKAALQ